MMRMFKKIICFILALNMLTGMLPVQVFANENEGATKSQWTDKSAVFVGDSITAGSGTTKTYYQFLDETFDFDSVTAMGVAGSCISAASDYGQANQPLIDRYEKIPSADLIVIFMGTNDYGHETPLGTPDDQQDGTFYGALNVIVPALVAKHPSSKIVFITPLHRYGFGTSKILGTAFTSDSIPNGVGATLEDYVVALKTVCNSTGVSVIDLYSEFTPDPADASIRSAYMPDGLHPNATGHALISEIMAAHIRGYEPVEKAPEIETEPETEEKNELVYGNKFVSGFTQQNRASARVNQYLKAGTVITLKNPEIFQWSCAKTSNETSSNNLGYFPDSAWSDKETAVVAEDGWVGFVFKYRDEAKTFDLSKPLSDYITIEEQHTHSYKNDICTTCGASKPKVPYDQLSTVWPSVNTDLTHIICYGQSFSTGSDAPYYNDPTVENVYVYGSITNSSKGTELTHLTGSAGNQHPIISAGNVFAKMLTAAGIDTDVVLGSYGSGGKTIAQLMSEQRQSEIKEEEGYTYDILSSGRYTIFQDSVAALAQYAQKNNQSISCPAIVYLQGETDQNTDAQLGYPENPARAGYGAGGDKEKYKEYMSRLKEDMQREVMEQYGQTEKPLFVIYQVSGTYTRTQYSSINMAQIEFAQENKDVILVQTPYFTSHYTNSHHLTQNGYRWLGEYIGRSIYTALVEREKPWPMLPESIEVTDSNTVRITVKGAQNGLTIDTWTVENASNSKNLYGFYVQADGKNIVPTQVSISGNSIELVLPTDLTSKTVHVYYSGKNASGTGNIRDNCTELGFYDYLDDSNDTGTGNNQGVSHSALDANGNSIIGQKYPLYNWLASFYYEVEVPKTVQKQPAYYHWEMQDNSFVSVTDGNATENKLTLAQGTVEAGMLNKVQYTMDKAIALEHDRPWVIEWKAAGNGTSYGGGKLLSASSGNDSYAQYLYTPADSRGLVAWGVSSLSANYGFQVKKLGIDPREEHTYRIENRIGDDGVNTIYLIVDGEELGAMNTGYRISSSTTGAAGSQIEEPYNWANGKNLYMDSIGASGSFLLSNMKLSYLKVWEDEQHIHSYTPTVNAPTCTEQGYTTYICDCGDSYVGDYVDARHSYKHGTCTGCGCKYKEATANFESNFSQNTDAIAAFIKKYERKEVDAFNQLAVCMAGDSILGRQDKGSSWKENAPEISYTPDMNNPSETKYGYQTGHFPPNMWVQTVPYKTLEKLQWSDADVKYYNHSAAEVVSEGSWVDAFPVPADNIRAMYTTSVGANVVFSFTDATYMKVVIPGYSTTSSRTAKFSVEFSTDNGSTWKTPEEFGLVASMDSEPTGSGHYKMPSEEYKWGNICFKGFDKNTTYKVKVTNNSTARLSIWGFETWSKPRINVVVVAEGGNTASSQNKAPQRFYSEMYNPSLVIYQLPYLNDLGQGPLARYIGKIDLSTVAPASPTEQDFYYCKETGVYTNFGGVSANAGDYIEFDGSTWKLGSTKLESVLDGYKANNTAVFDQLEQQGIPVVAIITHAGTYDADRPFGPEMAIPFLRDLAESYDFAVLDINAYQRDSGYYTTTNKVIHADGTHLNDKGVQLYMDLISPLFPTVLSCVHQYETVVTAPTCTEQGYTTYTCACGESYVADYVDADGEHDFTDWYTTKEAAYNADGEESRDCKKCSHVEFRSVKLEVVTSGNVGKGTPYTDDVTYTLYTDGTMVVRGKGIVHCSDWRGDYQPYKDYRTQVKTLIVEEGITATGGGCFAHFYNLETVSLPDSLTKIDGNAFMSSFSSSITSIVIPAQVTYIGAYSYGFYYGKGGTTFTDIFIENPNVRFVDNKAVFNSGNNLENLTLYSYGTNNNVSAYAQKYGCKYVDLEAYKTGVYSGVEYMYYDGVLTLSAAQKDAIIAGEDAPWNAEKNNIQKIVVESGIAGISANAFKDYYNLEIIELNNELRFVGDGAFAATEGCTQELALAFPRSVKTVGEGIFAGRKNISLTAYLGSAAAGINESGVTLKLKKQFKLLLIGNSYSEDASSCGQGMQDSQLLNMLQAMLGEDAEVTVALLSSGGKGINWHATQAEQGTSAYSFKIISSNSTWTTIGSASSYQALTWTDWDAVSLQPYNISAATGIEAVPYPDGTDVKFRDLETASEYMLDYISTYAPDAEIYCYMHWAQTTGTTLNANLNNYNKLARHYLGMMEHAGTTTGAKYASIIPVGLSIQNARSTYFALLAYNTSAYADGNLNLTTDAQIGLQRDAGHLSFNIGRYIAGLTFAEMIVPQEWRTDNYVLPEIRVTESVGKLPKEYSVIAQKSVLAAVSSWKNGSLAVTDIEGYTEDPMDAAKRALEETVLELSCNAADAMEVQIEASILAALPADFVVEAIEIDSEKMVVTATCRFGYTSATMEMGYALNIHNYASETTLPTCTEKGYTTYTCECGDSYVDDYTDATGEHSFENGVCAGCGEKEPITAIPMSMRYDDHLDMSGKTVEILDSGKPTSYQVGYGVEENEVLDTAVVTLEGNTLVATGIGTAMVRIDGELYEATVTSSPISLLLLIGQSNMRGSEGNADQSIVCPDGMVYATFGDDRGDAEGIMNVNNATNFAASALTGEYSTINVNGTTDNLSYYPINSLTEAGKGTFGPDSGFAYEWVKQTGEKVWVVNAAHGGSSMTSWQPNATNFKEAVLLFNACQETLRKEIAAGHFTLSHMGYFWCQGCSDYNWTAEKYVTQYLTMHNSLKKSMAFDHDSDDATDLRIFEFAGIIPVRAGHDYNDGYREDVYEDTTTHKFYESFLDLQMTGPRVAQYWMCNNPELEDIWMVCNIGEDWVWMPDGTNGVSAYFQIHYANGTVDYTTQVVQKASWYTPTTPATVHDSIHYNQIGYNEVGRESARNALIMLGEIEAPEVETTVELLSWDGYTSVNKISASLVGKSGTLIVPKIYPVWQSKDASYTLTDGFTWSYYDVLASDEGLAGELTMGGKIVTIDGHNWSAWETLYEASAAGPGKEERVCYHCGDVETREIDGVWQIYKLADHLLELPEDVCCDTNLWAILPHEDVHFTSGKTWGKTGTPTTSITISVKPGDKIYATSWKKAGENGHETSNGIRVTFFNAEGIAKTMGPGQSDREFYANGGYLIAPEGTIAINIVMWYDSDDYEVYILNRDHSYENGVCVGCSAEDPDAAKPMSMRYDDHLDMSGKTVEILDSGKPTSYQVGYGVEENKVLDTAVVTLEGNTLVATGIGTAMVRIDGELYEVTVTSAPISLLLLIGQSNMEGNEGDKNQSIVCQDGTVYATYGDRYDMVLENATHYAPSALTGVYREINTVGGTDGLSDYPVYMLTDEGDGRKGPDSGFAYEWVKQTGEKVWIVNASHGGTSLEVWQPGTTQYEECQAMFGACTETLRKEIAAGHFTLSHMAYFWCQGCNDYDKTAQWYVENYLKMHESLKTELAFDHDTDPETEDKTFEFGGIIPVRAGHDWRTYYREGVYTDTTDKSYYESFKDLQMSGPRVAQYWMGNNPDLADIWNVCTIGENWVWMPDGTNGVSAYFQSHYPNGTVDYTTQVKQSASWYTPTTPAAVHDSIHYNQIGYNEVGREAVRNALIYMGINPDYTEQTAVKFVDWTGYREVSQVEAYTEADSPTLVVPIVSPITRSKDVTYNVSQGLNYDWYDLTAEAVDTVGTLNAVGATGSVAVVKQKPGALYADHLSELPERICAGTNLWTELDHDSLYYTVSGWGSHSSGKVYSVTIPLNEGDRIWATSMGANGVNGNTVSTGHGIRVTFFGEYGVIVSMTSTEVYEEFSKHGYLTAPEGTTAVNVPMWSNCNENELYILNLPHSNDCICDICGKDTHEHSWTDWQTTVIPNAERVGQEQRSCSVCGSTENRDVPGVWQNLDLGTYLLQLPENVCRGLNLWKVLEHNELYFHSGLKWAKHESGKIWSVTIPIAPGDHVFATSFGKYGENGNTVSKADGIRVTFFDAYGVAKTMDPAGTYAEFNKNGGYLIAPEGSVAVNIPMWNGSDANEIFILNKAHTYTAVVTAPTCTEDGYTTCTCHCGDTYKADHKDKLDHSFTEYVSNNDATCTVDGTKTAKCDRDCGKTDTLVDTGSALGHDMGAWATTKEATCVDDGEQQSDCSRCDYFETKVIEAIGHEHEAVVTAPTCTEDGYTTHTCHCGDTYIDSEKAALGHAMGKWEITEDATCTEDGSKRSACSRCDHFETEVIEATGHSYTSVVTAPTCTEKGYTTHTCHCGDTYTDSEKAALGHDMGKWEITEDATCTEDGSKRSDCSRCDHFETEVIEAIGHSYTSVVTAPTCSEKGNTTHTCHCGDTYTDSEKAALGHDMGEWVTTKEATCMDDGEQRSDCSRCDHFETKVIAATGHNHKAVVTVPTCTEDGYTTCTCHCGDTYKEDHKDKLDHSFTEYVSNNDATCTVDGTKTAKCDRDCGKTDTLVDTGSALGHNHKTVVTAPTCTEDGYTTYTCHCGDTYKADHKDKLDHSFTEYMSNNDATCTEDGTKTAKCDRDCGKSDTLVDTGSALGHNMGAWTTTKEATCMDDGEQRSDCSRCDYFETKVIEAIGHEHKAVVTAPTCTENGYTTHTCHCGDTYTDSEKAALGHDMGKWEISEDATCTEDGSKRSDCSRCDHFETKAIDATGHNHKAVVTVPTCTEDGYTTYTCHCGDTYKADHKDKLGHSFTEYMSNNDATCTEDGTKTAKCDRDCGKSDTLVDTGSALGHNMGAWTTTKEATCVDDGEQKSDCSHCDFFEAKLIEATGHSYTSVVTAPTCTENGYTTHTCHCGDVYIDNEKAALGHDVGDWEVTQEPAVGAEGAKERSCKRDGCSYQETEKLPMLEEPKWEVAFANMTLESSLSMNFAFAQSAEDDWTGSYAEIRKTYADGRADQLEIIPMSKWGSTNINKVPHYTIRFSGIAAKEMGDKIHVCIYNADGEAASEVWTDSVLEYALRAYNAANAKEETKRMLVDMLNYGAAAQQMFKYDEEHLVNANLTEEQKAMATKQVETMDKQVKGSNYLGTNLTLESEIRMNVAFQNVTQGMHAEVSFTNHAGRRITERAQLDIEKGNGIVRVDQIVVADGRTMITITVYNADGTVHGNVVDSLEGYIARVSGKNQESAQLYEKILMFSDSAYNYLH